MSDYTKVLGTSTFTNDTAALLSIAGDVPAITPDPAPVEDFEPDLPSSIQVRVEKTELVAASMTEQLEAHIEAMKLGPDDIITTKQHLMRIARLYIEFGWRAGVDGASLSGTFDEYALMVNGQNISNSSIDDYIPRRK